MQNSSIEWTDATFNIVWGCQRVSPGCTKCYAESLAKRYGHNVWGPVKTTERRTMSENYWRQPCRWNEAAEIAGERRRVFCSSMADVFEDHPTNNRERMRLWEMIKLTSSLDWLLLTKRPENILGMIPPSWRATPPANVWYGTSVESQEYADKRIPELLRVPAVVRFLSCEPLLSAVDLSEWLSCYWEPRIFDSVTKRHGSLAHIEEGDPLGISWVICGGESGHGARPMRTEWARSLRDQCADAGAAFFMKQMGGTRDKGGDLTAIPEDLHVRQFPTEVLV